jgi:hypothetical protein
MTDMWGSSPTNIYVVGHNDQPGAGTMFRYDGTRWSTAGFHVSEGGPIRGSVSLTGIVGSGPNDLYVCGESVYQNPSPPPELLDSSLLIHFNGTTWSEEVLSPRQTGLNSIGAPSSQSFFAGGVDGIFYKRTSSAWAGYRTSSPYYFSDFVVFGGTTYALAYYPIPGVDVKYYFLGWEGNDWIVLDSMSEVHTIPPRFGYHRFLIIDGKLYSAGGGVYRWDGAGWSRELFTGYTILGLFGTRRDHLFAVGYPKVLYHFNGNDWYTYSLPGPESMLLTDVWCNEEEVFLLGTSGSKTYVYHGK